MIMLFAMLISIVSLYTVSKLVYQGEQTQSELSKGVTIIAVFGIIVFCLISWYLVYDIGDSVNRILGK